MWMRCHSGMAPEQTSERYTLAHFPPDDSLMHGIEECVNADRFIQIRGTPVQTKAKSTTSIISRISCTG